MLSPDPHTNPWHQGASDRVIEAGDLLAFDTNLAGLRGDFTDISRTYMCRDVPPTDEQRRLHQVAYQFVQEKFAEIRPGASFAELGERLGRRLPRRPALPVHRPRHGPRGRTSDRPLVGTSSTARSSPEWCFSLEAYIGEVGGHEGVEHEEQIIVHEDGNEILSTAPVDERLL